MPKFNTPFQFSNGSVQKNRTVLAPMTNGQSHEDGTLSDAELHWLELRAQGGFGMLVSAASHVQADAKAWAGQLGCFADGHIEGLRKFAAIGKKHKTLSILQLFHGGVRSPKSLTGVQPTAPSVIKLDFPDFETPRALEDPEIEAIILKFVAAGKRAHEAGLSGIEVHGANGYLFTQFLSQFNNKRTDRWGGSLENRARLLTQTVRELRKALPVDFLIGVRLLSEDAPMQKGFDVDETKQVIEWLVELKVDYIHISASDAAATAWKYPESNETNLHRFRSVIPSHIALVASGGIKEAKQAEQAIEEGADLVAIAKAAINTPDWPMKAIQPGFVAKPFPISKEEATAVGISPPFQKMLGHFKLIKD